MLCASKRTRKDVSQVTSVWCTSTAVNTSDTEQFGHVLNPSPIVSLDLHNCQTECYMTTYKDTSCSTCWGGGVQSKHQYPAESQKETFSYWYRGGKQQCEGREAWEQLPYVQKQTNNLRGTWKGLSFYRFHNFGDHFVLENLFKKKVIKKKVLKINLINYGIIKQFNGLLPVT